MFLALGVGAWTAALFHFMTHAFFKALLFLGAGVVIHALDEEHSIFKMGGLRRRLPVTFWTFLVASASLAALPLVTAGFYSKDAILFAAWSSPEGSRWLWLAGIVGALLTALYTARMFFVAFLGEAKTEVRHAPGVAMRLPLIVLGVLSVVAGFINLPRTLGDWPKLADFLQQVLPASVERGSVGLEAVLQVIAALVVLGGVAAAWWLFVRRADATARAVATPAGRALHRYWYAGWGFDWLYERALVRPYTWLARVDRDDVVDLAYRGVAWVTRGAWAELRLTEAGRVRLYAAGIALGAVGAVVLVVFS